MQQLLTVNNCSQPLTTFSNRFLPLSTALKLPLNCFQLFSIAHNCLQLLTDNHNRSKLFIALYNCSNEQVLNVIVYGGCMKVANNLWTSNLTNQLKECEVLGWRLVRTTEEITKHLPSSARGLMDKASDF